MATEIVVAEGVVVEGVVIEGVVIDEVVVVVLVVDLAEEVVVVVGNPIIVREIIEA